MVVCEARNDPALQPPHAEDLAPVLAIDAHRRPLVGPTLLEPRRGVLLDGHVELGLVQLWVLQPAPHALDVEGLGVDAQAQAAVHVRGELQLGAAAGRAPGAAAALPAARGGAAGGGGGQLGEAVRYGLELRQGRQLDVDVGLADLGLHDGLDRVRVQHAHGYVLGDDLLALAPHGQLEGLHVGVGEGVVLVFGAVALRAAGAAGAVVVEGNAGPGLVGALLGSGVDRHGEHGDAVFLGQAQGGVVAVDGGLEGALERVEGQLEVDGVGGLGGLDLVVGEDEVHGEGSCERECRASVE